MNDTTRPTTSLNVLPSSGKADQLRQELTAAPIAPAQSPPVSAEPKTLRQKLIEGKVIAACKQVFDPEIPVNLYDLGLIYRIDVSPDDIVHVDMTLTAPGCPVAGSLPVQVEKQIESIPEVRSADVTLVWEPAWDKSRMSEEALLELGMM